MLFGANIEGPLSLDEIAALVGLSRRQIERLFKRCVRQARRAHALSVGAV